MSKFTYVLLQNTLVLVGMFVLYRLTNSDWSFLCLFMAQSLNSNYKGEQKRIVEIRKTYGIRGEE